MTLDTKPLVEEVKTRLLPPSALSGFLEKLVECLPRHLLEIELASIKDVEVINGIKGEYRATGSAPSFDLKFTSAPFREGWYYLEAALMRHNGSRETSLHVYLGDKKNEYIAIPIATNLRGTVREVFYLPKNVTALTWQPTAAPGFFSQSPLLIHKISLSESIFRRLSRVLFDFWRFRNKASTPQVILSWLSALGDLQRAYQRTAALRIKRVMSNDYAAFIALNDTPTNADIRAMHKQASQLPLHPIISVVMPVQAPKNEFFRATLDSVLGQIYPHWELLLVGDFSADAQSYAIADEYRSKNTQVKIISVDSDADLAANLNSALKLAQGEFVVRFNQHDLMPSHALLFFAQEICNRPDVDFIYSDDDNIDDIGERFDPRFKPDWNPDLFLSNNYLANLVLYRHKRAVELGGYQSGFSGAEDFDFFLRYLKEVPATKIWHIPKVLCHVRTSNQPLVWPTDNLLRADAVHQSGKRALENYFSKSGITVEDGVAPGLYHIKHPLPTQYPLVSIIIPTRDRVEILKKCIESIQQKTDYKNWEMLVIDNQSVAPETLIYFEAIRGDSRIRILHYDKPFNYSALNNFAVQYARGDVLALLNNDVEVITEDWLAEMVSHAIRPEVGAVGAKLLYSNGTVQHAGVIIGLGGVAGHAHKYLNGDDYGYCNRAVVTQNLSAVTGACLVVRKNCYQEVGGLNEASLAVSFNDVDLCLRLIKAGYRNVFTPYASLYHHESVSRGSIDTTEKHAQLMREIAYMKNAWGGKLRNDSAYNSNLVSLPEELSLYQHSVVNCSPVIKNSELKIDVDQADSFDAHWYLETYPDVAEAGVDPLEHFINQGRSEGRIGSPFSQSIHNQERHMGKNSDAVVSDISSTNVKFEPLVYSALLQNTQVKLIAFYLPQFHPIPENDKWWGRGFTEWTNVVRAKAFYEGHEQPRFPGELGFYDLRLVEVLKRQSELARIHGVYGFCFYVYWFGGKRLLDGPIEMLLRHPEIDVKFCYCWANENWTRRWDGLDDDVLIGQSHSPEDDIAFIASISTAFFDERYVRIDGKPMLVIYRPSLFPDIKKTVRRWRNWCRKNGIGDIHVCFTNSFDRCNPAEMGMDSSIEFPPLSVPQQEITNQIKFSNPLFRGGVYSYQFSAKSARSYVRPKWIQYRGVMPSWDNTPRKMERGFSFYGANPDLYAEWLDTVVSETNLSLSESNKMVFVNAWNEWGEGAYLEPDSRRGYAYLNRTREVMSKYAAPEINQVQLLAKIGKKNDVAAIVHLFYGELFYDIAKCLDNIPGGVDLYFSIRDGCFPEMVSTIKQYYPEAVVVSYPNRGRDVLPFLHVLRHIIDFGYSAICKIHSKKSKHRSDGDIWRDDVFNKLLGGGNKISFNLSKIRRGVGIVAPSGHLLNGSYYWGRNAKRVTELALNMGCPYEWVNNFLFPAGTMFWFQPDALRPLLALDLRPIDFEDEAGQDDGTTAHAVERLIGLSARKSGLGIAETIDDCVGREVDYPFAKKT